MEKSGIIYGRFFCSRESTKNEGSQIKSTMQDSHINQRVIESEKYGHGRQERFSFAIITGLNVVRDFNYHILQDRVLFQCHQGEEQ